MYYTSKLSEIHALYYGAQEQDVSLFGKKIGPINYESSSQRNDAKLINSHD